MMSGRLQSKIAVAIATAAVSVGLLAMPGFADSSVPMYRMYDPSSGEHLYTSDTNEKNELISKHNWRYEGIGWYAPTSGKPVYRLYNPKTGEHHYTMDENEKNTRRESGRTVTAFPSA